MDLDLLQGYDRIWVWTDLPVSLFEPKRLIEGYRFVELGTGQTGIRTFVRQGLTPFYKASYMYRENDYNAWIYGILSNRRVRISPL
jgi:hypothetical protein